MPTAKRDLPSGARVPVSASAGLAGVVGVVGVWALALAGCGSPEPSTDAPPDPRALHFESVVIDTHSDTTPRFEDPTWDFTARHDPADGHQDAPRMREGGLDVQFWSIYMGEREGDGRAVREALERIDAVERLVDAHPDEMVLARSAAEIREGVAAGKLVHLMGVEGGHIIEDNLAVLRTYHRLGVRYMTLTHSFHTSWADSSGTREPPPPVHGGLTEFGESVVREMNRLGMMIDVSHVSDETFEDVLRVSAAPVIASHSSCRAVADHVRNLSDSMLADLAARGGAVMINFYPAYIDARARAATQAYFARHGSHLKALREELADDPPAWRAARRAHYAEHPVPSAPLESLLAHFDHALRVAGPDHVGLGADWDGVPSMPEGMEDVSRLPDLTRALLERGHSPETVRKVLGENLLRVMAEVEAVAARLSTHDSAAVSADRDDTRGDSR
ncbi:MAG: dipeptidase [Myxococcota bacterium]